MEENREVALGESLPCQAARVRDLLYVFPGLIGTLILHTCFKSIPINVAWREWTSEGGNLLEILQKPIAETTETNALSDALQLLLEGLNEQQKAAVTAPDGPAVVFAGPGSGKTTVLTRRVLYLIERGVPVDQLMLVTFTRAAAEEMKQRLEQVMPGKSQHLFVGTFHSLFLKLLKELGERVPPLLSAKEQTIRMRRILSELELPVDDESVSTYLQQIGLCKAHLIFPERMKVQKEKNVLFQQLYARYEEDKLRSGMWDFDDILLRMHERCLISDALDRLQKRFRHILVDEFQDVNRLQYEIVLSLAEKHRNLFVVGDDDQSIYGFRGSDPRWMLDLPKRFPDAKEYQLSINYRSSDEIIAWSESLIERNRMRKRKKREGTGKKGARIEWLSPLDEEEEAEMLMDRLVDGMQTTILYRTSTQARALVDHLVLSGIDFFAHAEEHNFYRRFQIQDVFAYFQLAYDPDDLDALARIINKPKRYVSGDAWMDACWNRAKKSGQSLVDALAELPEWKPFQKIKLRELSRRLSEIPSLSAEGAIRLVCEGIGYRRYLEAFAEETGNDFDLLWEPVEELLLAAKSFPNGKALMDHAMRVEQRLQMASPSAPIKLMTLHRSKGLEFERVAIIGLHVGVLPHRRSLQVPENRKAQAWEEERRLLYVGLTRAERELILSISQTRQGKRMGPSPFAMELGYAHASHSQLSGQQGENRNGRNREIPRVVSHADGTGESIKRNRTKSRPSHFRTPAQQPQLKFATEDIQPGMKLYHIKYGMGIVNKVEPLSGVAPGRKVDLTFEHDTLTLHYELSRQLGLIRPK